MQNTSCRIERIINSEITKNNVYIDEKVRLPFAKSTAVELSDKEYIIGIDTRNMTESEKNNRILHELGHCATGAFYHAYSPLETRSRCEHKAKRWAIKKAVPKGRLLTAFKRGYVEVWQLAEYFNVDEPLIKFACEYYFGS